LPALLNNKIFAFLKLIRIQNLLMIALTEIMLRYLVLHKIFEHNGTELGLSDSLFLLLVLSTVLIAAAGYIINDYFDVKTDLINHPDTVVLGKTIKRRVAIILHITLTFTGIVLGMYAALKTGYLRLAFFHFAAAILLWFYSTNFKKQFLVGNIVVALLTASVVFIPLVYELGLMQKIHPGFIVLNKHTVLQAFKITWLFGVFAFITSVAREIIKDMEDYKGDKATGGKTMPIIWGIQPSKLTVFFLLIITALLLLFAVYNSYKAERVLFTASTSYIVFVLILPLIILSFYTLQAWESKQFYKASQVLKVIMLLGLCYSFIYNYA
jgi:4-hydroxybenzoate polyprenyltransferase